MEEHIVAGSEAGMRLDQWLAKRMPEQSRAHVKRLIADGCVRVAASDRTPEPALRVRDGWIVVVEEPPPPTAELVPWEAPLSILHEDDDFVVVDKPAGLVVHPGAGNPEGTLAHALLARYPEISGAGSAARPGIVHRLDKGTSGALVAARTARAYHALVRQFAAHEVEKGYLAIVAGVPRPHSAAIDAPIGRATQDRKRFSTRARRSKPARTRYRTREAGLLYALLDVSIETGRTHQIRVHLTSIGHPILGDLVYGSADRRLPPALRPLVAARAGPFLHAFHLSFAHPSSGERVDVTAPVPADFERMWQALRG